MAEAVPRPVAATHKRTKLPLLLVTGDEALWAQVGAEPTSGFALKQLDSIDELIGTTPAGQAAIVLWDARENADPAAVLSRLHLHSSRVAVIALDHGASAAAWTLPLQHRQVVAHVALPIAADELGAALDAAHEEVNSRLALLGDGTAQAVLAARSGPPRTRWLLPAVIGVVTAAAVAGLWWSRRSAEQPTAAAMAPQPAKQALPSPAAAPAESDDTVDSAIDKAQQAMLERHYIEPLEGSALSLYRDVLAIDPDNGEARQGLQRLSEILLTRVQSALDERRFDVALQALETARNIDPDDARVAALDEKIAGLRGELGPAQILAALNAQNFDRAAQLIEDAARVKSLPPAKLAQLRDDVRKRREETDVARLLQLVDARLQQDHLAEPRNDSALYYLQQAKLAGATGSSLQPQLQEVLKRLMQAGRTAIEQRRFADAEHVIVELRGIGIRTGASSALQRELTAARGQALQKPDPQYLELAQARLAQGKLTEPANDNAFYYLSQARTLDANNAGLAPLTVSLQAQMLERARAALDGGDMEKSEALAQLAAGLGSSSDLDAFNERLQQRKASLGEVQLPEQTLTRLSKLEPQYPAGALEHDVEGWVEIAYTVSPEGSVANVRVLNSAPPKVFDASATKAVARLRYRPVVQGGKAISVGTQVRVVYRLPK